MIIGVVAVVNLVIVVGVAVVVVVIVMVTVDIVYLMRQAESLSSSLTPMYTVLVVGTVISKWCSCSCSWSSWSKSATSRDISNTLDFIFSLCTSLRVPTEILVRPVQDLK